MFDFETIDWNDHADSGFIIRFESDTYKAEKWIDGDIVEVYYDTNYFTVRSIVESWRQHGEP